MNALTTTTTIPIGIDRQLPCSNITIVNLGTRITLSLLLAIDYRGSLEQTRCTPGDDSDDEKSEKHLVKKHLVKHLVAFKAYEWYS
jgi:hypothetical protein